MPLQATSGAASYDAFGGGVPVVPNYIEEVFSTYLYAGSNSSQTITNNIDLSTNGGLVWTKARTTTYDHFLTDTIRGGNKQLSSNNTGASVTSSPAEISSFNTTGYTLAGGTVENVAGQNFVGWTFREQPKFFDVVTYTGTGSNTTIAHSLGSVPGCIIVKRTDSTSNWRMYHKDYDPLASFILNSTAAVDYPNSAIWNGTAPTSTVFSVGTSTDTNANGGTYVAYIYAHNAGGFGLTGTDNVISCGSTTANGSGDFSVTLGYEPQWVLIKSTGSGRWSLFDNMRGVTASSGYTSSKRLQPQASDAEDQFDTPYGLGVNATGFTGNLATFSNDFIYIAIRRGPMKVPTVGTSVFAPIARTGTGVAATISGIGFAPDLLWDGIRNTAGYGNYLVDKLRGGSQRLGGASTAAEVTESPAPVTQFGNTSVAISNSGTVNDSGVTYVNWFMQRAPSFFDEVCYSGTGVAQNISHNLQTVPELMITKERASGSSWAVYSAALGATQVLFLNRTDSTFAGPTVWNDTAPTASVFTVGSSSSSGSSGGSFVAYLFATCAGVSKVGSYTGNGTTQTINCGFTGGARFVLIKRTNATGDWYVWDTARGIVAGNDPHLSLNTTDAEVTSNDTIDTDSTGFVVNQVAATNVNVSSSSYIFLAIA